MVIMVTTMIINVITMVTMILMAFMEMTITIFMGSPPPRLQRSPHLVPVQQASPPAMLPLLQREHLKQNIYKHL